MKLFRKIIFLLACFSFLVCITNFKDTYAKYRTDISGTSNFNVARWRILVNNQDIRNNSSSVLTISPTFENNENIADGYIAPTAEGYFDIVIDCSAADVSFTYDISADVNALSSVTDLVISGYQIDDGLVQNISNGDSVTGFVLQSDNITTFTIRVFISWDDSAAASMDNAADTAATLSLDDALMDVNVNFTQLAS